MSEDFVDDAELVSANARVQELEEEVEQLRQDHAHEVAELQERIAELEANSEKAAEEKLLPALSKFEVQLSEANEKNTELMIALRLRDEEVMGYTKTVGRLEAQRDERDDMLRKEETKRRNAELKGKLAAHAVAQMRMDYVRAHDPAAGEPLSATQTIRNRILAWIGNHVARIEIGIDLDVCPLCRASPACQIDLDSPNVHGPLIPPQFKRYLKAVVTEAKRQEADPIVALEAWASGSTMTDLEDDAAEAAEEDDDG